MTKWWAESEDAGRMCALIPCSAYSLLAEGAHGQQCGTDASVRVAAPSIGNQLSGVGTESTGQRHQTGCKRRAGTGKVGVTGRLWLDVIKPALTRRCQARHLLVTPLD